MFQHLVFSTWLCKDTQKESEFCAAFLVLVSPFPELGYSILGYIIAAILQLHIIYFIQAQNPEISSYQS